MRPPAELCALFPFRFSANKYGRAKSESPPDLTEGFIYLKRELASLVVINPK